MRPRAPLYKTKTGIRIGAAYTPLQAAPSADALRLQQALLAEPRQDSKDLPVLVAVCFAAAFLTFGFGSGWLS